MRVFEQARALREIGAGVTITPNAMWYHTVGDGHIPALRCAIDSLGADGSCSAPTSPKKTGHPLRVRLHHDPEIDTGAAQVILDQDASALLGIGLGPSAGTHSARRRGTGTRTLAEHGHVSLGGEHRVHGERLGFPAGEYLTEIVEERLRPV